MEIAPEKFERFSYRELQKAAKSQGLNAGGKRETILKRLQVIHESACLCSPWGTTFLIAMACLASTKAGVVSFYHMKAKKDMK